MVFLALVTESFDVLPPVTVEHMMPRYFFHVTDGQTYPDTEGTELPGLDEARREAFQALADMLKGKSAPLSSEWMIDITDAAGHSVTKLTLSLSETRSEAA